MAITFDEITRNQRLSGVTADGDAFRLGSEARRMKWAHLADPFAERNLLAAA